jgi:phosphotriesterase-related protein
MVGMVNTVLGPIAAESLGKTMIHEHFVFGYPGYNGDVTLGEFNRDEALRVGMSVAERWKSHGIKTVVDPTPNDCGRNPELLKEISERTGMNIICATGYYYEGAGASAYFKVRNANGVAEQEIHEMFMKEITEGIGRTGIKPGIIKLASSRGVITDYEQMFFRAAAKAQKETGITIVTHTQEGTMGPEQAELLVAEGANPSRIVIGHMDGNTDVTYHLRTLEYGVSIAFDRFGLQVIAGCPMDSMRQEVLLQLIAKGYGNKIMLSHDTVNFWLGRPFVRSEKMQKLAANWHPTHIFENVIPDLMKAGITDEQIHSLFVGNPKGVFSG